MRKPVFSVKMDDLEVQTFRAGGKGGQNQNKRDTGVRIKHAPSGAVAESRSERTQLGNKKLALAKLGKSKEFQTWCRVILLNLPDVDSMVDELMKPGNIKVEVRENGRWVDG